MVFISSYPNSPITGTSTSSASEAKPFAKTFAISLNLLLYEYLHSILKAKPVISPIVFIAKTIPFVAFVSWNGNSANLSSFGGFSVHQGCTVKSVWALLSVLNKSYFGCNLPVRRGSATQR